MSGASATRAPRVRPAGAVLGSLAVAGYLVHAAGHVARGNPAEAFWACHLGALLVGAGLVAGRALPCAIGFLWLCVGDVLWAIDLAAGAELIPTSLLTHGLGLALGVVGVGRMGMPRFASVHAIAAFFALQLASRWLSPPATNLNLAHAVHAGWEQAFPSYPLYQGMLLAIGFAGFVAVEWTARRLLRRHAAPLAP